MQLYRLTSIGLTLTALLLPAPVSAQQNVDHDRLTQVSIINALLLGEYDGVMTIGDLLKLGDFGLGTCDHLDGELIVLDGVAYQARADGSVQQLKPEITTPFAIVTRFERDHERPCPPVDSLEQLEHAVDAMAPGRDRFYAIRVEGVFSSLLIRSVPRQERPYRPLVEIAAEQAEWKLEKVTGTLVAIRCPKWVSGIGVPGYHWHFLSADRKTGGHVLGCQLTSGTLAFDDCSSWLIELPTDTKSADLGQDLSRELERVEKQRTDAGGKP
ncbi:acetolactate decarboxylase [Planctomicrobium sp. SH664]|uniref:acetolactate decarboxylase n=1 Tax=Planctomicrobium sp. SH664 TaxID=3448125 RepID=UPI003F5C373D